ncbi:MAG: hypothetical protein LIP09_16700 [Bacteroidales bacterium]|nr:hypothetical protein [Bacteroidales bacterium]
MSILQIFIRGFESYKERVDQEPRKSWYLWLWLVILPGALGFLAWYEKFEISKDHISTFLTVLSILGSFVFGLLFLVPSQIEEMIEKESRSGNTHARQNIKRMKIFGRITVRRLSLFLVLVLLMVADLLFILFTDTYKVLASAISISLGYLFIWVLLSLVSSVNIINLNRNFDWRY